MDRRRLAGWLAAVLAAVTLVLFGLGAWNPGHLVVLWRFFRNPLEGATLFFALATLASWLLAPVRSEAAQTARARWRVGFVIGLAVAVLGWVLVAPRFQHTYLELARSGDRTVMLFDQGTDNQRLRVWVGQGLGVQEVGDLGRPCGTTTATFTRADLVHVATGYAEFDLRLDPATGRPLDTIGPTCSG